MMYFKWLTNNLIWSEGELLVIMSVVIFLMGWWYASRLLMVFSSVILFFCLYFFRNPDRVCNEYEYDHNVLICPADGKVVAIEKREYADMGLVWDIAIFLSPIDVHVNWIPTDGHVSSVVYRPGKFLVAYAPKSSEINECMEVIIESSDQRRILIRQIAGFVARRIVCWINEGDDVMAGDKYGMIKFGSRVEVIIPVKLVDITLSVGQHVYGGKTVLGRWL